MRELFYPTVPQHNYHDSSRVTRWHGAMRCHGFAVHLPLSDARCPTALSLSPTTLHLAHALVFLLLFPTNDDHFSLLG